MGAVIGRAGRFRFLPRDKSLSQGNQPPCLEPHPRALDTHLFVVRAVRWNPFRLGLHDLFYAAILPSGWALLLLSRSGWKSLSCAEVYTTYSLLPRTRTRTRPPSLSSGACSGERARFIIPTCLVCLLLTRLGAATAAAAAAAPPSCPLSSHGPTSLSRFTPPAQVVAPCTSRLPLLTLSHERQGRPLCSGTRLSAPSTCRQRQADNREEDSGRLVVALVHSSCRSE